MSSMCDFAHSLINKFDCHVIVFNGTGLTLFTRDTHDRVKKYSSRRENLNKKLYYIYEKNRLNDKPLFLMGRRKVNRGIGFHYAPRPHLPPTKVIVGKEDGDLNTNGIDGLIWTDMIMGNKIGDVSQATQKVGRGAGIVRHCPQYPGKFTYWIDKETSSIVDNHYKVVDRVNLLSGSNTIKQAISRAQIDVPFVRRNHDVELDRFRVIKANTETETLEITRRIVTEVFEETFRTPTRDGSTGKFKTSLNRKSEVVDLLDAIKAIGGAYGGGGGQRRFFPCYRGDAFYVVIPIHPEYSIEMKDTLNTRFGHLFVEIPQEGEIP